MSQEMMLESLPEPRKSMLLALKRHGSLGIADLSEALPITYEAVRQQLGQLELDGWVIRQIDRDGGPGRPRVLFRLTNAGEHLFPKEYDTLAVALIDAASDRLGPEAVRDLLEEIARRKTEEWRPRLAGKSFEERLEALEDIYGTDDPFCQVDRDTDGQPLLIETNCPFLEVAKTRPALCSVTVSVLRNLLGRRVVRTERFQDGDGRCVFKVLNEPDDKDAAEFSWEPKTP